MFRCLMFLSFVALSLSAQRLTDDTASVAGKLAQANTSFEATTSPRPKKLRNRCCGLKLGIRVRSRSKGMYSICKGKSATPLILLLICWTYILKTKRRPTCLAGFTIKNLGLSRRSASSATLKINPRSYKAYDNLGLCYEAKGDNERAVRYFLTAIKLTENDHPEYDSAYADLAELLLKTGDAQKAFDAASKATKRNSYSARNFYLGAKALEQLGKFDLSLNWLQRSIALDPNYPEPEYLLARVYRHSGRQRKPKKRAKSFWKRRRRLPVLGDKLTETAEWRLLLSRKPQCGCR